MPIYIKLNDAVSRFRILDKVIKTKALNMHTEDNFNTIAHLLSDLDDEGNRNRMAINFSIGECRCSDLVFEVML
jgi:hypothetical protein